MRELRDCINNAMFAKQKSSWQALLGMCMPAGYSAICTAAAHWRTLWSKTGQQQLQQNESWRRAAVVLPVGTRNISFVGVAGHSPTSDMAIDSIELSVSTLPPTTPTSRPSSALGC